MKAHRMTVKNSWIARAKINLCLHVIDQRDDGYHLLDSLVCFAQFGDRLHFEPAATLSLQITGPMAAGVPDDENNLIMQAARLLNSDKGATITLEKHLPMAAGIGGGSADCATTLLGLGALWDKTPDMEQAASLGADVPVCLRAKPARIKGIGTDVHLLDTMPSFAAVLLNPNIALSTPQVFKKLAHKTNVGLSDLPKKFDDWLAYLQNCRNDLQAPAIALCPMIAQCLAQLEDAGAQLARMSGSGATCFGIFSSMHEAKQTADYIAKAQPDWWVIASQLN